MRQAVEAFSAAGPEDQVLGPVTATLYELIEAINEEVQPEEGGLVAATVLHLANAGKIRLRGEQGDLRVNVV